MKTLNPNDFGKNILVENCQKIRIEEFLKICRIELKRAILNSEIETMGLNIAITTSQTCFNGIRFWFVCPLCDKRAGVLFSHPITAKFGCRTCLGLEYRGRRCKGMIEGENPLLINNRNSSHNGERHSNLFGTSPFEKNSSKS